MSVPARQIRAGYSADTITGYQAYSPQIAAPAVAAGRFVAPFKRDRMTWIKPSFLWMMYRCGWATKPGQEHVLAVEITRAGFEWALAQACLSHYDRHLYENKAHWSRQLKASPVRVQWDPERSLRLKALSQRGEVGRDPVRSPGVRRPVTGELKQMHDSAIGQNERFRKDRRDYAPRHASAPITL